MGRKGSSTVEAAIALPIFLCAVVSIAFIIKIVYVHEKVQHALTQTAYEISSLSYLLHISGLIDINDSMENGLEDKKRKSEDDMKSMLHGLTDILNKKEEASSPNSEEQIESLVYMLMETGFEDIKTQICIPLVKAVIKKHFTCGSSDAYIDKLENLSIVDGFEGLDFSDSSFFSNSSEDVDIIVRYKIGIPLPIPFLGDVDITQRACARAWLGGEEADSTNDDIWNLKPVVRGMKLEQIYGANLPVTFPVLDIFDRGKGEAVMITSMDLTLKSYQTASQIKKALNGFVDKIGAYAGQLKPWGRDKIIIGSDEIRIRKLILVIPKNSLGSEIESELDRCVQYAQGKGVILEIERYGVKKEDIEGTR